MVWSWNNNLINPYLQIIRSFARNSSKSYSWHLAVPLVSISLTFYARKFLQKRFAQLFSSYILALEFLVPKFCMINARIKHWWNCPLVWFHITPVGNRWPKLRNFFNVSYNRMFTLFFFINFLCRSTPLVTRETLFEECKNSFFFCPFSLLIHCFSSKVRWKEFFPSRNYIINIIKYIDMY